MASDLDFIEFVVGQLEGLDVSYKKMFGEYALYLEGKVVALICDNQLFVKPTEPGRAFIGEVVEAPAYPGARPSFLIGDGVEDSDWFRELLQITEAALPKPKPKKPKAAKKTPAKKPKKKP